MTTEVYSSKKMCQHYTFVYENDITSLCLKKKLDENLQINLLRPYGKQYLKCTQQIDCVTLIVQEQVFDIYKLINRFRHMTILQQTTLNIFCLKNRTYP